MYIFSHNTFIHCCLTLWLWSLRTCSIHLKAFPSVFIKQQSPFFFFFLTKILHSNWHQADAFTDGFFCSTWSCLPMDRHSLRVASWMEALGDLCEGHVKDCIYCLYTLKTFAWTWLHRLVIGDWSRRIANLGFIWEWYQDYLKKQKTEKGLGM